METPYFEYDIIKKAKQEVCLTDITYAIIYYKPVDKHPLNIKYYYMIWHSPYYHFKYIRIRPHEVNPKFKIRTGCDGKVNKDIQQIFTKTKNVEFITKEQFSEQFKIIFHNLKDRCPNHALDIPLFKSIAQIKNEYLINECISVSYQLINYFNDRLPNKTVYVWIDNKIDLITILNMVKKGNHPTFSKDTFSKIKFNTKTITEHIIKNQEEADKYRRYLGCAFNEKVYVSNNFPMKLYKVKF